MDLIGSATLIATVVCGLAIPAGCGLEILIRRTGGTEEDEPESRLWQNVRQYKLLTATLMIGLFMVTFSSTVVVRWNGAIESARFQNAAEAAESRAGPFLPPPAKDIEYHAAFTGFHVRFDLTEAEFLAWADQQGWPLLTVGPAAAQTSNDESTAEGTPDEAPLTTQHVFYGPFLNPDKHLIQRGYFCKVPGPNADSGALVGYDTDEGHVYFAVVEHKTAETPNAR